MMEVTAAERADPRALARHLKDQEAMRNIIDVTDEAEDDALSDDAWIQWALDVEDVWHDQWEDEYTYEYAARDVNQN